MITTHRQRLEQGIGWGLVVLIAIMPFHAFLSVWLGSLIGNQSLIQSWKEVLTVLLLVATSILIYLEPTRLKRGEKLLWFSALVFALIALVVTIAEHQSLSSVLYGIKTDFEFIALFFVALWGTSQKLYLKLPKIILVTSGIVAAFAILHATTLPHDILTHFGYGSDTVAPFQFVGSLSDTIRTPSTLGGPNQLGSFLILPLSLAIAMWIKRPQWSLVLATTLYVGALWYTYSRSAWLGALCAVAITAAASVKTRKQAYIFGLTASVVTIVMVGALLLASQTKGPFEYFILHSGAGIETENSTTQHADALIDGIESTLDDPLGDGLGSAGPASFQAETKLIPENYYLQLAIETGILGSIAFIIFTVALGIKLWAMRYQNFVAPALIGALVGISVINLFLHGWADSSTAFIYWITAGAVLAGDKSRV